MCPQCRSVTVRFDWSRIHFPSLPFSPLPTMDTPSSESESYDRSRRREAYRRPGNRDRGRAGGSGDEDRTADISDKLHILANTLQVLCLCKSRLHSGWKAFKNVVLLPSDCSPKHHFTSQDTSRNLTKVDQTLGQYRNYADSQAEAMAQVHLHHPDPSHWAKNILFQPLLMLRTFSPLCLIMYCMHVAARGQPNGGNQPFSDADAGQIYWCPEWFTILPAQ